MDFIGIHLSDGVGWNPSDSNEVHQKYPKSNSKIYYKTPTQTSAGNVKYAALFKPRSETVNFKRGTLEIYLVLQAMMRNGA